jgi:hypothetical protein
MGMKIRGICLQVQGFTYKTVPPPLTTAELIEKLAERLLSFEPLLPKKNPLGAACEKLNAYLTTKRLHFF